MQGRARQFHSAGIRSLQDVAFADYVALSKNIDFLSRKAAQQIIASAKVGPDYISQILLFQEDNSFKLS